MKNQGSSVIPLVLSALATLVLFVASMVGHSQTTLQLVKLAGGAFAMSLVWFVTLAVQDWRGR